MTNIFFILLVIISLLFGYSFYIKQYSYCLLLIFFIAITGRLQVISDPEIHDWDEKYHALVAKNLIKTPLTPSLYKFHPIDLNSKDWTTEIIWLSKPPVPLWIMSISIYTIGENTFGIRLPSLIIALLAIFLTYLIGKELFNKKIGIISAFLHSINGLLIELVGGRVSSDHVEHTFLFFFELAIFLTILGIKRKTLFIQLLIGVCIGLSFLSKWQIAVLIFPVWIVIQYNYANKNIKQIFIDFAFVLIGTICIVFPWLFHIYNAFPAETTNIFYGLISPFQESIQNHSGPWYYYINKLGVIFGELVYLPLLFIFFNRNLLKDAKFQLLLIWIIFPLILFSISETKRFTYILVIAPAIFIIISHFIQNLKLTKYLLNGGTFYS